MCEASYFARCLCCSECWCEAGDVGGVFTSETHDGTLPINEEQKGSPTATADHNCGEQA